MKKEFVYSSREEAFKDISRAYRTGIDFNSPGMIEFCLTEVIRDGREDEYWVLKMIFLLGSDNPSVISWFVSQVNERSSWPSKCYKLIKRIFSLYWNTGMKNKFDFITQNEAYAALVQTADVDSPESVDYWMREFLRDSPEDMCWLNRVINAIGHDEAIVKYWFSKQVGLSRFWTEDSYSLIVHFANALGV